MTEIRSGLGWGRQEIRSLGTWQFAENWPRRAGSWHWQLISGSPACPDTLITAFNLEARAVVGRSHNAYVQPLTAPGLRRLSYSYSAPQITQMSGHLSYCFYHTLTTNAVSGNGKDVELVRARGGERNIIVEEVSEDAVDVESRSSITSLFWKARGSFLVTMDGRMGSLIATRPASSGRRDTQCIGDKTSARPRDSNQDDEQPRNSARNDMPTSLHALTSSRTASLWHSQMTAEPWKRAHLTHQKGIRAVRPQGRTQIEGCRGAGTGKVSQVS